MKTMIRPLLSLAVLIAAASSLSAGSGKKKIALYDDAGSGGAGIPSVQRILDSEVKLDTVTADQIRAGGLAGYDAVIFTGGSGSKQSESLQPAGIDEVRKFVENGGGYMGICAGAYLACDGFSWSAHMLNAKTVSQKWRRGKGNVEMELTEEGKKILGEFQEPLLIKYNNGPIIKVAGNDLPDFVPLAYFRTEMAENGTPAGVMVNSPAIVASTFGKGRIITISPHPEQTDGLAEMVKRAADWVATSEAPVAAAK